MIFIYSVDFFELSDYLNKQALLIDLRELSEFQKYHIPSSVSIHQLSAIPTNKMIIFICNYGNKAKEYASYYHQHYLEGGIYRYNEMLKAHSIF